MLIRSVFRILFASLLLLAGYQQWAFAADSINGKKLYTEHCQNCHGNNGVSQFPGTPNFSRGEKLLRADGEILATIKAGTGMMPAYQGIMSDEEILDVIAHLRTLR